MQYYVNRSQRNDAPSSFSYAISSADFQREVDYARQASQLFNTQHTFVSFEPEDFPGLLERSVDLLGQPPILETEPSMLSIAEYSGRQGSPFRYFFSGQGADTVFGLTASKKLKSAHQLGQIPGARTALRWLAAGFAPQKRLASLFGKAAGVLLADPHSFYFPPNTIAIYTDLGILRRCFGDEALKRALWQRRNFVENYTGTRHYLEQVHLVDLLTDTYELGVQRQQIFLGHSKEQLHPFFDDDILRAAFAFPPDTRYIRGTEPKYLLKDLLEAKTRAAVTRQPKGFSVFEMDLLSWMKSGPLRERIEQIELPDFLSHQEFELRLKNPDYFVWVLLNYDLFRRHCLD